MDVVRLKLIDGILNFGFHIGGSRFLELTCCKSIHGLSRKLER
jgi:hypothetical protein